jgi:hypothetical protein
MADNYNIILLALKDVKPEDLENAINSNFNLVNLLKEKYPLIRLAKYFVNREDITLEKVLITLRDCRPDLFNVIIKNLNGIRWVRKNIDEICEWIWTQ